MANTGRPFFDNNLPSPGVNRDNFGNHFPRYFPEAMGEAMTRLRL